MDGTNQETEQPKVVFFLANRGDHGGSSKVPYRTLSEAYEQAEDGDTILVPAGTYPLGSYQPSDEV